MRPLLTRFAPLALLLAGCLLTAAACERGASDDGAASDEAKGSAAGQTTLVAAPAPDAGQEGARVVEHLESLHHIAVPLKEHCDEMARDLTTYLELARADFAAARAAELGGDDRALIAAAYGEVSRVTSKCMNVPGGREFGRMLLDTIGDLRRGS